MARYRNLTLWLHSLVATVISGAAGATGVMVVDPIDFNFTTGLQKLLTVAAIMGVIALLNYLKEHPVPPLEDDSPSMNGR